MDLLPLFFMYYIVISGILLYFLVAIIANSLYKDILENYKFEKKWGERVTIFLSIQSLLFLLYMVIKTCLQLSM